MIFRKDKNSKKGFSLQFLIRHLLCVMVMLFNFAFIEIGSTWLLLDKLVYGMLPITTMLPDK